MGQAADGRHTTTRPTRASSSSRFRTDLFDEEVFVFTPKGEVKTLPAGATPIDFAYAVHTDVGHRTVGAKVNGRIVPLHYKLHSGDRVEILTVEDGGRGPSRDWLSLVASSRARNKIRQFFSREQKEDLEAKGREALEHSLKAQNLPYRKLAGSAVLAGVIRESGYKKAEDFYIALGSGKLTAAKHRQQGAPAAEGRARSPRRAGPPRQEAAGARRRSAATRYGINVVGVDDVLVRLAKCCTPVPGDDIVGYISLGKGITIHRGDCPNVRALMRNPERFTPVEWEGGDVAELPRPDRRRLVGPAAPARGRRADVRRARREHRLLRRHRRGSDGEELVRGRGRRREGAPRRCSRRSATSTPSSTRTASRPRSPVPRSRDHSIASGGVPRSRDTRRGRWSGAVPSNEGSARVRTPEGSTAACPQREREGQRLRARCEDSAGRAALRVPGSPPVSQPTRHAGDEHATARARSLGVPSTASSRRGALPETDSCADSSGVPGLGAEDERRRPRRRRSPAQA